MYISSAVQNEMSGNGIESLSGVPGRLGWPPQRRDACRASTNLEKAPQVDDVFSGVSPGIARAVQKLASQSMRVLAWRHHKLAWVISTDI